MKATTPLVQGDDLDDVPRPPHHNRDGLTAISLLFIGVIFGYSVNEYSSRRSTNLRGVGSTTTPSLPHAMYYDDDIAADDDGAADIDQRPLPPLSDLIDGHEVKSDVSWLLNFAVIGNAKSGTTFLKNYLGKFDEIYMDPNEICKMSNNRTDQVVEFFHDRLNEVSSNGSRFAYTPDGRRIKTGLKCPKEVGTKDALRNYATHFPDTDFIVTVRHPVHWFESFYNYRSYGAHPQRLPPPRDLVGPCVDRSPYVCPHGCGKIRTQNVCTDRAKFHHQLSRFGKTPMVDDRERRMLRHDMEVVQVKSRVFLAELGQFVPENEASERMAEDLSKFLGLERQLPSLQEFGGHRRSYTDEERTEYFIDICHESYDDVRDVLLDIGREAARWITEYFIASPDVVVSSRDLFVELLDEWGRDPCASTQ